MIDDHNTLAGIFFDHAAEKATLGGMIGNPEMIAEVEAVVPVDAFHLPVHAMLFRELLALRSADAPTDPVSLLAHLAQEGLLPRVPDNGMYVHTLTRSAVGDPKHFARIVADRAVLRKLDAGMHAIQTRIRSGGGGSAEVVEAAREMVSDLADSLAGDGQGYRTWDEIGTATLVTHENRRNGEVVETAPIPTGFSDLDRALGGGLRRRELVVVAGRSGDGKSTFAGDLIREAAFHQEIPTGLVAMEMPAANMFNRLICAEAGVKADEVGTGFADYQAWTDVNDTFDEIKDAPLFIDDTRGQTFAEIRLRAKRLKQRHGIQVLAVDYLGLIEVRDNRPKHQQIEDLCRQFHGLADELDVAVVLLAQLNRNAANRTDKRPILSDLKESSGIEANANIVIFVHRPEKINKDDRPGEADLVVAKSRNGPEVVIPVAAQLHLNRFWSMALED